MSVYRCYNCEYYFDEKEVGCFEHPYKETEIICLECSIEIEVERDQNKIEKFNLV